MAEDVGFASLTSQGLKHMVFSKDTTTLSLVLETLANRPELNTFRVVAE